MLDGILSANKWELAKQQDQELRTLRLLLSCNSVLNYLRARDENSLIQLFALFRELCYKVEQDNQCSLFYLAKLLTVECLLNLDLRMKLEFMDRARRCVQLRRKVYADKRFDAFFQGQPSEQDYLLMTFFLNTNYLRRLATRTPDVETFNALSAFRDEMVA